MVKNLPANAGDVRDEGSNPGLGRCHGEGRGNPLQYSCLENPMDSGAWQATVHRVKKSDTTKQLSIAKHIFGLLKFVFALRFMYKFIAILFKTNKLNQSNFSQTVTK